MDKMKGLAKGGWHPPSDKQIHRDTWKSDLKGIATRKNKDPYEEQRNHQSAPLASLQDPNSFGPPPKHSAFYGANGAARSNTGFSGSSNSAASVGGPTGGWGAAAVEPGYAQRKREQEEAERKTLEQQQYEESTTRGPYQKDTTGLTTDNLPKPPVRRNPPTESHTAGARQSPTLPPRSNPRPPPATSPRQNTGPPPSLPPRQNEYPDEYTPAPPPPYQETLQQANIAAKSREAGQLNQEAMQRLGRAGVSVSGLGIGGNDDTARLPEEPVRGPQAPQLSELQQRFARMNTGAASTASTPQSPAISTDMATAAAHKKPPPPPPKKAGLGTVFQSAQNAGSSNTSDTPAPPPIPMGSKPKPS